MIKQSSFFNQENRIGLNSLETEKPVQGDRLLTTKVPRVSGTYLIDLIRKKGWVDFRPHYLHTQKFNIQ